MKTSCSTYSTLYRDKLENKYQPLVYERLDLRKHVTFVPNKGAGRYGWLKYKEAFSRELVHYLVKHWGLTKRDLVYDPFAGCGTTLLACKELGLRSVGTEILPFAVFVTNAKLTDWNDIAKLRKAVGNLINSKFTRPKIRLPDIAIISKAFPKKTQDEILFFKEQILKFTEPERTFLLLGLLAILEEVSYTRKDGQYLRLVEKDIPPVAGVLKNRLYAMLSDIEDEESGLFEPSRKGSAQIFQGDAREMSLPKKYTGAVSAVITSPPYLNRYDYSRTYALELCTLWVNDFSDMRNIRHSLLRSHIESKQHSGKEIHIPVLNEILEALNYKHLNNPRIPIMVNGYFEDMNLCLRNIAAYLKPNGVVALVIANARFAGEMVPTDLILSELALNHGLKTEEIWISRYKGNSSQQMAKYGRVPVRETIVFWRKTVER